MSDEKYYEEMNYGSSLWPKEYREVKNISLNKSNTPILKDNRISIDTDKDVNDRWL